MAMTRYDSSADAHTGSLGADSFVLLAKALVAAAVGCGLYLQAGASLSMAAGIALATYLALVTLHIVRSRSLRAEARSTETATADGGRRIRHPTTFRNQQSNLTQRNRRQSSRRR